MCEICKSDSQDGNGNNQIKKCASKKEMSVFFSMHKHPLTLKASKIRQQNLTSA